MSWLFESINFTAPPTQVSYKPIYHTISQEALFRTKFGDFKTANMRNITFLIAVLLVLCVTVFAGMPEKHYSRDEHHDDDRDHCLTTEEAEKLRDLWISFFVHIGDGGVVARKSLVEDFKLFSQSTNAITPSKAQNVSKVLYNFLSIITCIYRMLS